MSPNNGSKKGIDSDVRKNLVWTALTVIKRGGIYSFDAATSRIRQTARRYSHERHLRHPTAGRRTYVNLDVGLIELADLNDWTSQTFGLGMAGALADLNELNITTRLIDAPVVATGAASGRLEGRIKALFYRYKSVGGYDYISDFFGNSTDEYLKVHKKGTNYADVTEGSGGIWERLNYNRSDPKHIVLTTTDSNLWGGRSGHTYTLRRQPNGRPR